MFKTLLKKLIILIVFALICPSLTAGKQNKDDNDVTPAEAVITNYVEATYEDTTGASFSTVSPTITITVQSVLTFAVTPDETEYSATVRPSERITRLFRICNTGNVPDSYTILGAQVTAPAQLIHLYFDTDASGTLTESDEQIPPDNQTTPRLDSGACIGIFAVVDTKDSAVNSLLNITLTASSNSARAENKRLVDKGTIIQLVGEGVRLTSPHDSRRPPVMLVENLERAVVTLGQTVNYTISFRNASDMTAQNALVTNLLPADLEYAANTLRLGGRPLTDDEDADEGQVRERRIEIQLSRVAPDEIVHIAFQARIKQTANVQAGIVNAAVLSGNNFETLLTSEAIAMVDPFGIVYAGRGGSSGNPVAGARVSLLADQTGTPLSITPNAGIAPNTGNENPFLTEVGGHFNFTLAPEQLGSAEVPKRFYLNITAPGYDERMLEVAAFRQNVGGLFTVIVRALDNQLLAQANSYGLTAENVRIENLAVLALNVPMFESSPVKITKNADKSRAEIGDVISYRIEVHNSTTTSINDAIVNDQLPISFHYAAGTVQVASSGDRTQIDNINVSSSNNNLSFSLGRLEAGARTVISYRVRVGVNAREGENVNTAVCSGSFSSGERFSTATARSSVFISKGLFSTQQVIIGRVFEDANANGLFDNGEQPMAGVRLYLNNGQSVITDSAGLYNLPAVNDGAAVISIDPVTVPSGYTLVDDGSRASRSWTRLLRTPLGGGSLLRQNFPVRSSTSVTDSKNDIKESSQFVNPSDIKQPQSKSEKNIDPIRPASYTATSDALQTQNKAFVNPIASDTYEVESTETIEPISAGDLRVISPSPNEVIKTPSLSIIIGVAENWTAALEVNGTTVSNQNVGERRIDRKNKIASFTFVGINLRSGPNKIKVTTINPEGISGRSIEHTVYGRGVAKRLVIVPEKRELPASSRNSMKVRVQGFDQWGNPAADDIIAVETSAGALKRTGANSPPISGDAILQGAKNLALEQPNENNNRQMVSLKGGEALLELFADNAAGTAKIRASTGNVEASEDIRFTAELRPAILVGLAEMSFGAAAPENLLRGEDKNVRGRLKFFYRGSIFGENLLTLAYDSERPLNRFGSQDRVFQLDPLDRVYPIFGDHSTRFEDAQSNSKLYARVDRGNSYALFGDFETEGKELALAGYTRKLTGVKLHLENSQSDFISVTGARPNTSFARDVFPGGGLNVRRLSYREILPGSEQVVLEVRDRRNPEQIISRETLVRSIDYNLEPATGEIFFLRPVSIFDYALNLVQIVVTYEHHANGMSSAVYTARAVKNFEGAGLRLGFSILNQQQGEFGSFVLAGIDGEKRLPRSGWIRAEWATSRGKAALGGNLFNTGADERHDGNAFKVEMQQPLKFKDGLVRASFIRADAGFLNPFGASVAPGSQRATMTADFKVRPSSIVRFGLSDERNKTENVDNDRLTASFNWTESFSDRFRLSVGYDFRKFTDSKNEREISSNLLSVGAEWRPIDKLELSVKREQNLGAEADPTYPNQTLLAANYKWNKWTRIFFTQRLASAPITPISDAGVTGFAGTGSSRETALGVETQLGNYTSLNTRYQLENGINGTDSFAIIGLTNRLPVNKRFSFDFGYERGFHLAGEGKSFNAGSFGLTWQPSENFRSSGRFELNDRNGLGTVFTLGAAGRLGDGVTVMAQFQNAGSRYGGRENSGVNAQAAFAWRPLKTDRAGLLFNYTHRSLFQSGQTEQQTGIRDRSHTLSTDGYFQATKNVELYGRFALKYNDMSNPELPVAGNFTYLAQGRVIRRLGRYFDTAAEIRMLAQPASRTRRTSLGAELGYWVMTDLRLGAGYNFTAATEPTNSAIMPVRRGFYFTVSSKLSNLFDLFGTSKKELPPDEKDQQEKTSK